VLKQGDGAEVKETDYLHAQYSGWNLQGEQFDSSWERGAATAFSLQQVIQGWTKGLAGQKLGSQVMLIIPAEQAYGAGEGNNESGQPLGDLIFVVDLLAVN
jgi:peptidylprolyl isomerase